MLAKVPLLPCPENPRPTPFVFKGCGAGDQELMNRLLCPIPGTKLVTAINEPKVKKEKLIMPAITDDAANAVTAKVAKAKGKASAKAKSSKANAGPSKEDKKRDEQGTVALSISQFKGSARKAVWLDDLICCLQHVCDDITSEAARPLASNLVCLALEFAFSEKLTINQKVMKYWSQVRLDLFTFAVFSYTIFRTCCLFVVVLVMSF